jgi:hypothetical protein
MRTTASFLDLPTRWNNGNQFRFVSRMSLPDFKDTLAAATGRSPLFRTTEIPGKKALGWLLMMSLPGIRAQLWPPMWPQSPCDAAQAVLLLDDSAVLC